MSKPRKNLNSYTDNQSNPERMKEHLEREIKRLEKENEQLKKQLEQMVNLELDAAKLIDILG